MSAVELIPVYLGGPADGLPLPTDSFEYIYVPEGEDVELARYRLHKTAPQSAERAIRYAAWDRLSYREATALAWEWLLARAFDDERTPA